MTYPICPHCDKETYHPDDCYETMNKYDQECNHCGNTFGFTIEYDPCYSSFKAPCMNGGDHNWRESYRDDSMGITILRCEYCDLTKRVDDKLDH